MKDFGKVGGRLRVLPVAARVVYSVFVAFTLVALGLTAWLADEMVGLDLAELDSYYAGGATATAAEPLTAGGPALELPDEPVLTAAEPMPRRKLLEVTHFHLFSMPVYLLVLSHLFMLSTLGNAQKLGWIAAGSIATVMHMAAPWVAASGTSAATWLYAGSGTLLGVSFFVMSIVPLWEMWRPAPKGPPTPTPG